MKISLAVSFILFQLTTVAQNNTVSNAELKALVGNWAGTSVNMEFNNGQNQVSLPTSLVIIDRKDSLQFNFVYTQPDGKQVTETNHLYVYNNSSKLSFDSAQFDIAEISRRGGRLTIYAERVGYENYYPVDFSVILLIGPGILTITKGIRSGNAVDFAIRKRLILAKK